MLAIPLDNKQSTTLSKLYGKAPYFALLDIETGAHTIVKNDVVGQGPKSADFLKEQGATSTIYIHMGEGVYKSFEKNAMDVYCANYKEFSLDEIYREFGSNKITKLNNTNCNDLLDPGEGQTCKCGCND